MKRSKLSKTVKLLVIIYLAFISLGLPDGILGVAWPNMRIDMGLPLEVMGVLTAILFFCSAFSSIASPYFQKKLDTSKITFISCLVTGGALLGYSFSVNFVWLIFLTIPLGLGQGAVDSVLNNYVADHYTSKHMNWLHCFWGVGASLGPYIMTSCLLYFDTWRIGYTAISSLQLLLAFVLLISLLTGSWNIEKSERREQDAEISTEHKLFGKLEQGCAVSQFFLYTGLEFSMSTWISSVLVELRGIPASSAGFIAAAYYASIMVGRFASGIVVDKLGNMKMIRIGISMSVLGGIVLIFVSDHYILNLIGIVIFGIGLAPLYPCLMHETKARFKKNISSRLIGYQVGAAWLGGSIVSAGIGIFLGRCSLKGLFPILVGLLLIYCILNEYLHNKLKRCHF